MSAPDLQHPVCRPGIRARDLANGMVYLRHPKFSSLIIRDIQWSFIQLCDGRDLEELNRRVTERLGFEITLAQLRSSVNELAELGVFEGTAGASRHYRLFDASPLLARISPLVKWLTTRWFALITLAALIACLALLIADWGRFINEVARAAREHPVATILLYYLTFIPIALLHELGHAMVIHYYGGEVPEVLIRSNAHFAVLTNTSVLKERAAQIWYLSMGTVVDIYIWLALLIAFHYSSHYLLLMFLLPQTIYFLLYSYSIFNNSDYLKAIAIWLNQPIPARPWRFIRDSWRQRPADQPARRLLYLMTLSLAVKLLVTAFLIWTFLFIEYLVLVLYAIYKLLVYAIGHWPQLLKSGFSRLAPKT